MGASKFQFQSQFTGSIEATSFRITGVSVITEGPALGHGVMIDRASLESVRTCAETYAGLKVKMNHGDGAESIIGRLTGFRIDGAQLRADLQLLKSHPQTQIVLEMAETMPESFGLSISFSGALEGEDGKVQYMRCLEIYSCDIVDQPAANPNGLFSRFDTAHNHKPMTIETPEYLALQAEHKTTCELGVKLKTDLEAANATVAELSAKLSTAETTLSTANKTITDLQAGITAKDAEHKTALADFDAKVAEASQRQLAASGTTAVQLGSPATGEDAGSIYEAFVKADPVTSRAMFADPVKGPLIQLESARRLAEAAKK